MEKLNFIRYKGNRAHLSIFVWGISKSNRLMINKNYYCITADILFIKFTLWNTNYKIPFTQYLLSNTIYQITFIKYHLSNTIYQIPFIKYHLCLFFSFCLYMSFQSRDLEDWETQEATMSVCVCLCHKR